MNPTKLTDVNRAFTCLSHESFLCRVAVADRVVVRPVCAIASMATSAFSPGTGLIRVFFCSPRSTSRSPDSLILVLEWRQGVSHIITAILATLAHTEGHVSRPSLCGPQPLYHFMTLICSFARWLRQIRPSLAIPTRGRSRSSSRPSSSSPSSSLSWPQFLSTFGSSRSDAYASLTMQTTGGLLQPGSVSLRKTMCPPISAR